MRVNVYIQPDTDEALSKLGGANRAENLRRAVALAECADELAKALECHQAVGNGNSIDIEQHNFARSEAREALAKYKEAKQ